MARPPRDIFLYFLLRILYIISTRNPLKQVCSESGSADCLDLLPGLERLQYEVSKHHFMKSNSYHETTHEKLFEFDWTIFFSKTRELKG